MTKKTISVPWPTIADFTCGPHDIVSNEGGKNKQQYSPSNPQAPTTTAWGPTHSSEDETDDSVARQKKDSHSNVDHNSGSSSGNRTNPNQGSDKAQSPTTQDAAAYNARTGDKDDDHNNNSNSNNNNNNNNKNPSMKLMWERAGNLKRQLMTSTEDMISFAEFGDVCFAATGAMSSPCINGLSSPPDPQHTTTIGCGVGQSSTASDPTSNRRITSIGNPICGSSSNIPRQSQKQHQDRTLDISKMRTPFKDIAAAKQTQVASKRNTTPAAGAVLRPIREHEEIEVLPNHKVQVRLPPTDHPYESHKIAAGSSSGTKKRRKAPVDTLTVKADMAELERSISELTMRSSYAAGSENLNKIPDNRRMAYYAVGKHHRQSGRGGNRRCYFTGKLILGGAPFYAGSVQQGLRTLVVFCLPSALGLPPKDTLLKSNSNKLTSLMPSVIGSVVGTTAGSQNSSPTSSPLTLQLAALQQQQPSPSRQQSRASSSKNSYLYDNSLHSRLGGIGPRGPSVAGSSRRYMNGAASVASKSMSKYSSLDDLSLSIDGDLDPNWGLDRDYLLSVLPEANESLIKKMSQMYPEQFETLPVQVRDPKKWKLYVKFCFFSGLPIADGEMHYKVRDDVADQVYGEEIVLSHEVMEAVNGESAEILTLPNQKAFRYLRKHYTQQCSKLDEVVFRRNCWERVAPEV